MVVNDLKRDAVYFAGYWEFLPRHLLRLIIEDIRRVFEG
jgi:hypothetical protein